MISLQNITKKFKGDTVLDNICLKIHQGESLAIIGPSGSGKTTLIRTINGFVIPDNGSIFIDGKEIKYSDKKNYVNWGKE